MIMKKVVIAIAAAGVLWAWFSGGSADESEAAHGVDVFDRVWIEKMPTSPKQKFDVFIALDEVAPHFGVFERVSAYEGSYSVFEWKKEGDHRLKLHLLQKDKWSKVKYKVSTRGCGEFDYCLELKGAPLGGKKYGSMKGWEIETTDPTAVRALVFGNEL